jgi:hypothetical protein
MKNEPNQPFLFTILLGCRPAGRNTEQHDVMFGVANSLQDLIPQMKTFWYKDILAQVGSAIKKSLPGFDVNTFSDKLLNTFSRRDKVHIDAWMKMEHINGYNIAIVGKDTPTETTSLKLYFINLGGYKAGEFEEFHKKLFVVATGMNDAKAQIMADPFMKEYSPNNLGTAGKSHVDDRHEIDFEADDIICVNESIGSDFKIVLQKSNSAIENETMIGYLPISYKDEL